ncbi:hypothetical protein KBD45_03640, partial [Candidatus Dojkabacteria bacterium]|nr:hypothetical protein [Candidatus Dojkabacteria bacterium]
ICGTATGQIAVEFKKNGCLVSGSEKGLYPPMSDHILSNDIKIEIGYKAEHLQLEYYKNKYGADWNTHDKNFPDEIIYIGTKGSQNEEYIYAKDNLIPMKFYPEVLKERVVIPEKSVVIAGTYGKTTITSMLAWIFKYNGIEVSYMFGGLNPNLKNGAHFKNDETKFSIVEGDEYMIAFSDQRSKFFEYSPKFLILTSAQWDHTDMFKTKQEYLFNFKALVDSIPQDGIIIYDEKDQNLKDYVMSNVKAKVLSYSDFDLDIAQGGNMLKKNFDLKVLGDHNQKNALAAFGMAKTIGSELGLTNEKIIEALSKYIGLRRRLEVKFRNDKFMVIDDFGSTPHKARVSINSLIEEFPDKSIYAIFEPNTGSRTARVINEYQNTFDHPNVKKLFLPRFTNIKGDYLDNNKLAEYLIMIGVKVDAINDDSKLVETILFEAKEGGIIIFLGSHGFRGLIEKISQRIHNLS